MTPGGENKAGGGRIGGGSGRNSGGGGGSSVSVAGFTQITPTSNYKSYRLDVFLDIIFCHFFVT